MAIGDFLTWAVQSQDSPAHAGRFLQTVLLNEGVVDVAGGSFQVQENTGADMNIQIGSGVLGDLAAIEGDDGAGQGVYVVEAQNATVTRAIAASDPSDDRIDLVVLQNYDDEADSSGLNDAEVEVVQGTPAASPAAPALPASAIPLAEVLVGAGVTSITNANITDTRTGATLKEDVRKSGPLGVLGYAEVTSDQGSITSETDLTGLTLTLTPAAGRRIRIRGNGEVSINEADSRAVMSIHRDGVQVGRAVSYHPVGSGAAGEQYQPEAIIEEDGSQHTYKLRLQRTVGSASATLEATSTAPAFIVVEDIGPA